MLYLKPEQMAALAPQELPSVRPPGVEGGGLGCNITRASSQEAPGTLAAACGSAARMCYLMRWNP